MDLETHQLSVNGMLPLSPLFRDIVSFFLLTGHRRRFSIAACIFEVRVVQMSLFSLSLFVLTSRREKKASALGFFLLFPLPLFVPLIALLSTLVLPYDPLSQK